jgi:NADH-quinone oxidoreductase subunit N
MVLFIGRRSICCCLATTPVGTREGIPSLVQTEVKRMLGYAAIAQAGFASLCLLAATTIGYQMALFYIISYALGFIAVFAILAQTNNVSGLYKRNAWLAFMLLLGLFSMAGFPPLLGFAAKFTLLQVLVNANYGWLALFALLISVIVIYPYLKIVQQIFAADNETTALQISWFRISLISLPSLLLLFVGWWPQPLLQLCKIIVAM